MKTLEDLIEEAKELLKDCKTSNTIEIILDGKIAAVVEKIIEFKITRKNI
jgi:hypothetical protein